MQGIKLEIITGRSRQSTKFSQRSQCLAWDQAQGFNRLKLRWLLMIAMKKKRWARYKSKKTPCSNLDKLTICRVLSKMSSRSLMKLLTLTKSRRSSIECLWMKIDYYELLISLKMKVLLILQGTLALKLTESL